MADLSSQIKAINARQKSSKKPVLKKPASKKGDIERKVDYVGYLRTDPPIEELPLKPIKKDSPASEKTDDHQLKPWQNRVLFYGLIVVAVVYGVLIALMTLWFWTSLH